MLLLSLLCGLCPAPLFAASAPGEWKSRIQFPPDQKVDQRLSLPKEAVKFVLNEAESEGFVKPGQPDPGLSGQVVLTRPAPEAGQFVAPTLRLRGGDKGALKSELLLDRVTGAETAAFRVGLTLRVTMTKATKIFERDLRLDLLRVPAGLEVVWRGAFPVVPLRAGRWQIPTVKVRQGKVMMRIQLHRKCLERLVEHAAASGRLDAEQAALLRTRLAKPYAPLRATPGAPGQGTRIATPALEGETSGEPGYSLRVLSKDAPPDQFHWEFRVEVRGATYVSELKRSVTTERGRTALRTYWSGPRLLQTPLTD